MFCSETRAPAAENPEQTLIDLGAELCNLVGIDGYRALIGRALQLATADFPMLKQVRPALAPPGRLAGFPRLVQPSSETDTTGATNAILAELRGLLEQLVGEDLMQQTFGDVYPTYTARSQPPDRYRSPSNELSRKVVATAPEATLRCGSVKLTSTGALPIGL